jgi:serine/threonine-protein kinase RsbW
MVPSPKDDYPWQIVYSNVHPLPWRSRALRTADEIVPAIEDIVNALQLSGYCDKEMFAIRLALEEALVNAIKHGHKGDPSKKVQLRYQLTMESLLVEIEDQGPGFRLQDVPDPINPENLERPCGRGLLLMQSYMTWVRFNDRGNRVTMCRQRRSA